MEPVKHPYECTSKGHEGASRTFYKAPPEWWYEKGLNLPTTCPDCRAWNEAQQDSAVRCDCGNVIRTSARKKISVHKYVGPYREPKECERCERGEKPPKGVQKPQKRERQKKRKEDKPNKFKELTIVELPAARELALEGPFYERIIVHKKEKSSESREMHLLMHVPGSRFDATAYPDLHKSPTSFTTGTTMEELLGDTAPILLLTNTDNVREYTDDKGRVFRITYTGDHENLEFTVLEPIAGTDGFGLVSTFDTIGVDYVMRQGWYHGR